MEVAFVGLLVLFCLFGVHNKEQALDVLHTGRVRGGGGETDRQAHREREMKSRLVFINSQGIIKLVLCV